MKLKFVFLVMFFTTSILSQNKNFKPKLKPYVDFLSENKFPTAKDYILNKFKTKDIVIISERNHQDLSQYEFIFDVLKDPKFKGNIYIQKKEVRITTSV